ncbi:MAG TPA: hypothetical protein VFD82_12745 [Planctomycetota bacterium]|nr:hypothetical protein [Planctomycetota bacterium]
MSSLEKSQALWNRTHLDLRSDEILAQILDRGSMDDWRELYALAVADPALRQRICRVIATVPLPLPRLWLSALAVLGEPVDPGMPLPVRVDL